MVGNRNGVSPMKLQRLDLVLAILLVSSIAIASNAVPEPFEPPPIFGSTPPTAHWIWYVVAGQKDRSAPVVYISTRKFKTRWPEVLIVLPRAKYNIVSHFVQTRLAAANCPLEVQKPLPSYAVQILEHHGGHTSSCMISQASTCEHIADVMKLPGMDWSPAELNIFDEFARGDKCKSILDPPR
jgi:hypothetical protein